MIRLRILQYPAFALFVFLIVPSHVHAQTGLVRTNVAYVAVSGTQAALWSAHDAGLFRK